MIVVSRPIILSRSTATLDYPHIMWQNLIRSDSIDANDITVSSESDDGPRDAPLSPDTVSYWLPTSLPATWQGDLGIQHEIDYVGLVHTLGTSSCAAKVETSPDSSVWTTLGTETMPADNSPLVFINSVRTARHVRITLTGATAPRIAVIYVGKALAMEMQIVDPFSPITMSRETVRTTSLSRGGQFLGQGVRSNGVTGNPSFKYLSTAWVRLNFIPFARSAAQGFPYFWAWNPLTYPHDVGYVWAEQDIVPQYSGMRDLMDVSWPHRGVGQA